MAKRFAGFTPEQLGRIDPSLKGMQSDEQEKIIAANPALAARVGKMTQIAQKRIGMGGRGFAEGGVTSGTDDEVTTDSVDDGATTDPMPTAGKVAADLTQTALESPETLVKDTEVEKFTETQKEAGKIEEGTGEADALDKATATVATPAATVTAPVKPDVVTVLPETVSTEVSATLSKLEAATGKPSEEALADAATMSPEDLKSLGLTVEQIEQARRVEGAPTRKVEAGEMIEGATVDMERVRKETNFEAATGAPSTDATVQGQLTGLMEDFEGAAPPAWAAGAMRAAAARMASRGLSSSSMAGQAIVQAAMESAIPIASQDAKTVASFEMQNLSNRQQTAMFAAQQRAQFLGLEFNQEFQARVTNAAKISDIANMNFSAEQQIALENARMAQTVDITNLNAQNAKIMADAAAMSQVDMANLNNRQQANVQAANAFLQMDMANLSNEQQTTMFAAQAQINAMLSDQAAENAALQFNASSENQVNQFFADLGARVQLANADQANAMARFNAGEANALAQFNTAQANQREQFNSTNRLVVAQANAQWAQTYTTADNAAINEANRLDAQRQGQMTLNAYNATIQTYRDLMSFANNTANNDADRATSIITTKIGADAAMYGADQAAQSAASEASSAKTTGFWSAVGSWAANAFS